MEEEKSLLASLPPTRFKIAKISTRKVYHDCHIYVDYNYYSVPYAYVGKTVSIELTQTLLKVFYKTEEIALHKKISEKGEFSTLKSHYPDFKVFDLSEHHRVYKEKMAGIGPNTLKLFDATVSRQPKYWTRTIKGILSLTKLYSNDVIEKSCTRAMAYELAEIRQLKEYVKTAHMLCRLRRSFYEYDESVIFHLKCTTFN